MPRVALLVPKKKKKVTNLFIYLFKAGLFFSLELHSTGRCVVGYYFCTTNRKAFTAEVIII